MPKWLTFVVPALVGVGVFVAGVVIDGDEFEPVNWFGYVCVLVLIPLLALSVLLLVRSFRPDAVPQPGCRRSRFFLHILPTACVILLVASFLFALHLLACGFRAEWTVQALWQVSAVGAAVVSAMILFGVKRYKTASGLVAVAVAVVLALVAVPQSHLWLSWRESIRFVGAENRAVLRVDDDHSHLAARLRWADRMIELRPGDWRGYVRRYKVRKRMASDERFADAREAIRLGCEEVRYELMKDYYETGQFAEAAREGKALVSQEPRPEDSSVYRSGFLATIQLDAGEFDDVIAFHSHMKAIGKPSGRTSNRAGSALMARGEYAAAIALLSETTPVGAENPDLVLAWLLATCPDAAVRDGSRAAAIIDEYLAKIEQALRDDGMPRSGYRPLDEVLAEVKREAQPARVAALAEAGKLDEARVVFDQWKKDEGWARHPHHNGFWVRRYARLDACLREGKPYRDEPEK